MLARWTAQSNPSFRYWLSYCRGSLAVLPRAVSPRLHRGCNSEHSDERFARDLLRDKKGKLRRARSASARLQLPPASALYDLAKVEQITIRAERRSPAYFAPVPSRRRWPSRDRRE